MKMIFRYLAALLVAVSMATMALGQQAPPSGKAARYKQKIEKYGTGHRILVETHDGKVFAGKITEIKDSSVVIDEVDLKAKVDLDYDQISYVEGNYAGKGAFGKRVRPHR